jgi:hypothetical protein
MSGERIWWIKCQKKSLSSNYTLQFLFNPFAICKEGGI